MIVIDASLTASWLLAEENFSASTDLLDLLSTDSFLVPPHWPNEVGNAIRKAVRTGRIQAEDVESLVTVLASLDVAVIASPPITELTGLVHFALENNLSIYDAVYVRLAGTRQVPLGTLDDAMKAAAHKIGVVTLPA